MSEDGEDFSDATAARRAMQAIADGLARIERERARIRPEDWATLFRQIETVLLQLAKHDFIDGDMEAEILIDRILRSENLVQVDERTDDLIEYALRKAEYVAALRAAKEGKPVEAPKHVAPKNISSEVTRAEAASGPSGDDFMNQGQGDTPERPRRSLLRL